MAKSLFIALICLMLCSCYEVSSGNKIGVVTALNHQGIVCKTYEAELIRGGMNAGSGSFGLPFHFTIESPRLVQQIQTALDKQQKIKIYYHREWVTWYRSESHNIFLDKVEVLD